MLRVPEPTPDGTMEPQPETDFPATLSRWVQEIVLSVPGPARGTIAALMIGAMLAQGGPVTWAVLALTPRLGWQAYHWMLARGRFRLLGLVAALCGIVRRETCGPRRFAIIDDTLAPRCSEGARRCRAVRPCEEDEPPGLSAVPSLCHALRRRVLP
jgi:hypothetical protein